MHPKKSHFFRLCRLQYWEFVAIYLFGLSTTTKNESFENKRHDRPCIKTFIFKMRILYKQKFDIHLYTFRNSTKTGNK